MKYTRVPGLDDWIEFYVISAIFQPCNGGYLDFKVIGNRFFKAVSSLKVPSLYITVSVKNNKRLNSFHLR